LLPPSFLGVMWSISVMSHGQNLCRHHRHRPCCLFKIWITLGLILLMFLPLVAQYVQSPSKGDLLPCIFMCLVIGVSACILTYLHLCACLGSVVRLSRFSSSCPNLCRVFIVFIYFSLSHLAVRVGCFLRAHLRRALIRFSSAFANILLLAAWRK
jgi:hypothetical protein